MHLLGVRIHQVGPFEDVAFPFCDDDGPARLVTVVHGAGGVGKTSLLLAIAATRPGHAISLASARDHLGEIRAPSSPRPSGAHVVCDWALGGDEPERNLVLRVASPNARVFEAEDREAARRREQLIQDKRARESGFAFLAIPSSRWFSRQPVVITSPSRTIARHEVRPATGLDDTPADLTREVKQALAYAEVAGTLAQRSGAGAAFLLLADAMRSTVERLAELAQFSYCGIDPASFEPTFRGSSGPALPFDALPTRARHLIAIGALAVRTLWAAHPGVDPRLVEGVVLVDEVCLHQDRAVQATLAGTLRSVLPRVQWILTTTSSVLAGSCDTREVLALRRLPESERVTLFVGEEARTH